MPLPTTFCKTSSNAVGSVSFLLLVQDFDSHCCGLINVSHHLHVTPIDGIAARIPKQPRFRQHRRFFHSSWQCRQQTHRAIVLFGFLYSLPYSMNVVSFRNPTCSGGNSIQSATQLIMVGSSWGTFCSVPILSIKILMECWKGSLLGVSRY